MGLWERWRYPKGVAWEGGALVSATQEATPPYASPLSTLSDCMLRSPDAESKLVDERRSERRRALMTGC